MLTVAAAGERVTEVRVAPATSAVVSWNSAAPADTLELVVSTIDGRRSRALPYVAFECGRRASLDGFDGVAAIETDIVRSAAEIVAIEVRSRHPLRAVAVSTPPADAPRIAAGSVRTELDVPQLTQYVPGRAERGWCTPASVAMLLAAAGCERTVTEVAAGVYDRAYGGTGNWAFAVAYAGAAGLSGAAAFLRDVITLEAFVAAGLPVAVSTAWRPGGLPGAPLPESEGHLLVVRGFDARGDVITNDPAQPAIRHVYPRAAFERCWLGHGGAALLVAPADRYDELARCANA